MLPKKTFEELMKPTDLSTIDWEKLWEGTGGPDDFDPFTGERGGTICATGLPRKYLPKSLQRQLEEEDRTFIEKCISDVTSSTYQK
ncbi:MAG: hypothetical protein AABY26_04735 [Nanoarchaeota archaeon]